MPGLGLLLSLWGAAETIVFQEDFSADLASRGWIVRAAPEQSLWTIDQGVLRITHFHRPYDGGSIEHPVPVLTSGLFDFDARIGGANNHHLSLQVYLYNLMTAFNAYGDSRIAWNRYSEKLQIEHQRGWAPIKIRLAPDTWHRFRIAFDAQAGWTAYYVDDLDDPVFVDTEAPAPSAEPKAGQRHDVIRLANYGLSLGPVTTWVDNLVLRRSAAATQAATQPARGLLLFLGMTFDRYRLDELAALLGPSEVRRYLLQQLLSQTPRNRFRLERFPSPATLDRMAVILLADMPVGPADAMPAWLLKALEARVRAGATLVVLGGLWTLGKGRFQGSLLEPALPVTLRGPWEVVQADPALTLEPADPRLTAGLAWQKRPCVMWFHALPPRPSAHTLVRAGPHPLLVLHAWGRGRVLVFLGAACGRPPAGGAAFWQWADWPRLLARAIRLSADGPRLDDPPSAD